MSDLKDAALGYARRGWSVFPLHGIENNVCTCGYDCKAPGKHPVSSLALHGFHDATTDPAVIGEWWDKKPNSNIGIATGQVSNLWVLDVDNKRSVEIAPDVLIPEGQASIRQAEEENNERFPVTLTATTGSGGRHYLYEYPGGYGDGESSYTNRASILPSVDVRADGGYIVAAPSHHISGGVYRWDNPDVGVSGAPRWFLLSDQRVISNTSFEEQREVGEGGRNDYLYRYGCSLLARGRTLEETGDAVFGANFRVCNPPLTQDELGLIISSLANVPSTVVQELDLDAFKEARESPIPELSEGDDLALSLFDLMANPPAPLQEIVGEGILDEGNGFILAGQPNLGKSWIALDLALSVASGSRFLGHYETNQGGVLIVDEEGSTSSMYQRMRMLLRGRDSTNSNVPIHLAIQRGIRLDTPKGRTVLQRLINRYRPSVVVMDSLIRFHSGDENSSRDMSHFFDVSKTLQSVYGVAMVFLHHIRKPSKDDMEGDLGNLLRGSGDIRGWPDGIIVAVPGPDATRPGSGMVLHHIKSRDHQKLDAFRVGLIIDNDSGIASVRYLGPHKGSDAEAHTKAIAIVLGEVVRLSKNGLRSVTTRELELHLEMDEIEILGALGELLATKKIGQVWITGRSGERRSEWTAVFEQVQAVT